jgi:aminopeptidase N
MRKRRFFYAFFLLLLVSSAKAQTIFPDIDVQHYTFALALNDANNSINGKATIAIKFLNNVRGFQLNLVKKGSTGKGMLVTGISEGDRPLRFTQDDNNINIVSTAMTNSIHTYAISYSGIPADGLIISTNRYKHRTFFGDNWPDRAQNWLPCADYPSDKATVDFIVTAPDHYQVVANGTKVKETILANRTKITHWSESAELPTKVMVIGVADFAVEQSGDVNGVPVYNYVFPENKAEGFKNYNYAPAILTYYNNTIGPYAYEKLANVQSKTIFGGMENASAIFYFENSAVHTGDEALMAHEIAHQWFGDAVTEKTWANVWLSEGFATYMTICYLENKYGADSLKINLAKDRRKAIIFSRESVAPIIDTTITGDYMQLLNANSYQKGSWVLHMLRRKLGDTLFWKGIRNYYAKYKDLNANTADFEQVMEQSSGKDLHTFFKQWLYTPGHPDLRITWKYDEAEKIVEFNFEQKQTTLFDFPLEIKIDGQLYRVDVSNRETNFNVPLAAKPVSVIVDPDVNLLAEFEVMAQ